MKTLVIACLLCLSCLHSSVGSLTSKDETLDTTQIDLMVKAHNVWREKVGCAPLTWSTELAKFAQQWADHLASKGCELKHRQPNSYGENIYWSSGMTNPGDNVVDSWGEEIENYNAKKNTCKNGEVCGHYTQVVWCNTKEVGCGMAKCGDEEVWVCNYNPPGNYEGERPFPEK